MSHWQRHWNLYRDPFDARCPVFVELPVHVEAVARLVHSIDTAGRSASLVAGPGLGKSRVLARALEASKAPERRIARINGPTDGADLFGRLAIALGASAVPGCLRSVAWRALVEAARLCRWQGLQVVLAVDDCHTLTSTTDLMDLERLNELDPDPSTRLTVIRVGRSAETESDGGEMSTFTGHWSLNAKLQPLTRSEAARYVTAKLQDAGRVEPTFTPRSITRIHATTGGVPRGIDRVAGLSLMAAGFRGLEMVTPDVVEEVAAEWLAIGQATY